MTWAAIVRGCATCGDNPVVLGCMTLDMFAVILGGATALLPVYAQDILQVGAGGYGLLSGSLEIGALAMSALLLFLPSLRRAGLALLLARSPCTASRRSASGCRARIRSRSPAT